MTPPAEIHILVIFSCQTGEVERLALAAAVGAVQARANIRLRRMTDGAGASKEDAHNENTRRMNQDYMAPRAADTAWAHGLVLAIEGHYLPQLQALGGLAGKPAVSLVQDRAKEVLQEPQLLSDNEAAQMSDQDRARLLGRQVAETARARKGSSQ